MSSDAQQITYFAETDFRNTRQKFGVKASDRTRHMYVIGKTGMGKSTMLENMAIQDILNGNGLAVMDPHGDFAEKILEYVPEERINDVVYFAPFDMDHPISFNVMEDVGYDKRHLVVSGLMSAFEKIWADAWSARMAYILQNTLFALLEYPDSTLLDINKMLVNKTFRKDVVDKVTDPTVKSFWVDEFAKYTDRYTQEATPAIQNKIGQFTSNPLIRNIVGQPNSTFDIRKVMDDKKILIMNLSKGRIGESNTNLLGSMLITKIYLAAMSRADDPNRANLPNFYFFVDEFQSFANKSFADILSEARKYKLNLTIAHQYIEQMDEEVRSAVFGNVGSMIVFRVGSFDADIFEKEFAPQFVAEDIVNLGFAQIYLRLMIDGVGSKPFSATTLPPIQLPPVSMKNRVIEASRALYARPRVEIEEVVRTRQAFLAEDASASSAKSAGSYDRKTAGGQGTTNGYMPRPSGGAPNGVRPQSAPQGGGGFSRNNRPQERDTRSSASPMPPSSPNPSLGNTEGRQEGVSPNTVQTKDTSVTTKSIPPLSHGNQTLSAPAFSQRDTFRTKRTVAPLPGRRQFTGPAPSVSNNRRPSPSAQPRPATPSPMREERQVSLSSLKKDIAHTAQSTQNKNALRDALQGVLATVEAQGKASTSVSSSSFMHTAPVSEDDGWKTIHGEPEFVKKPFTENAEKSSVTSPQDAQKEHAPTPKEIPETILRKVLDDL